MPSNTNIEAYAELLSQVGVTTQAMENSFSQITLQRGINYFNEDRVTLHKVEPDLNDDIKIEAEVRGSEERQYGIEVTISIIRNQLSIIAECDCPVGFRCKHAVATVLEFSRSYEDFQQDDSSSSDDMNEEQEVENWLQKLKTPGNETDLLKSQYARPAANNSVLLYVLKLIETDDEQGIEIQSISARRLKKGGYGKGREQNIDELMDSYSASYVNYEFTPLDVEIAGLLQSMQGGISLYNRARYFLSGDVGELTLKKLLQSNKLFWQTQENSEALMAGEQRALTLDWQRVEDNFYLDVDVASATAGVVQELFYMNHYYYIDPYTNKLGLAQHTEMDETQIQQLISAPPIPFSMAEKVSEQLIQIWPESNIPLPLKAQKEVFNLEVSPTADVILHSVENEQNRVHILSLRFDYGAHIIQPEKDSQTYQLIEDEKQYQIVRDMAFEKDCINTLSKHHFVPVKQLPGMKLAQFRQLDYTLIADSAMAVLWHWHD
ncbi:MAG: hypothetical protein KAI17_02060, partial [Thiotrichaceae bacterium]|nr:hypothetical protein [Thiotrichaceae bacterium]